MASIKTQFSELRAHTPKHIQWLLLAAAFVVVIILFVVLTSGGKKEKQETVLSAAEITIMPNELDWSKTKVGEIQSQTFTLSANLPVKIDAVRISKEMPGLSKRKTTCINIGQIYGAATCSVIIDYAPTAFADASGVSLFIDWRGVGIPEKMANTLKIPIAIGTVAVAKAAALPVPSPVPDAIAVDKKIKQEIDAIANSDPFSMDSELIGFRPEPKLNAPTTLSAKTDFKQIISDKKEDIKTILPVAIGQKPNDDAFAGADCSEFAFGGYNAAGVQIGWIKPDRGGYNFHPFSDKKCDKPTGVYNPDNGIITDINNPSKKIGTDLDHIGFANITNGNIPKLSNPVETKQMNKARQLTAVELVPAGKSSRVFSAPKPENLMISSGDSVASSQPYDRTFILRQYKPIPATIVSEIRADKSMQDNKLPVRATVDRNVYSDNGRTVIVPTGTLLMGYVTGDAPGPYKSIGRMQIEWYQFIRPDGVEFNFAGGNPFSADAQGRAGVPGRGSTDYVEQFLMPMLTAIVPAAVNMIAPISDKFVNQIDLNNNTVTQTGNVRSSELAKAEIIKSWNQVAQKLMVDAMDNTVPPFSIASGTRITVFSPMDLLVTCGTENDKKCAIAPYGTTPRMKIDNKVTIGESAENAGSLVGQVRSFDMAQYCDGKGGVGAAPGTIAAAGIDYRTVVFYCQSIQYQAKNNAKADAVYKNQNDTGFAAQGMIQNAGDKKTGQALVGTKEYNEQVLGLKYKDDGTIANPFKGEIAPTAPAGLTCEDGVVPDTNGCCTGETYTDMGDAGFNCCPGTGGDCFPPIK